MSDGVAIDPAAVPVPGPRIEGHITVNEIIREIPATLPVFHGYGIDACCGGGLPVSEAARRHGVAPAALPSAPARAAHG